MFSRITVFALAFAPVLWGCDSAADTDVTDITDTLDVVCPEGDEAAFTTFLDACSVNSETGIQVDEDTAPQDLELTNSGLYAVCTADEACGAAIDAYALVFDVCTAEDLADNANARLGDILVDQAAACPSSCPEGAEDAWEAFLTACAVEVSDFEAIKGSNGLELTADGIDAVCAAGAGCEQAIYGYAVPFVACTETELADNANAALGTHLLEVANGCP